MPPFGGFFYLGEKFFTIRSCGFERFSPPTGREEKPPWMAAAGLNRGPE